MRINSIYATFQGEVNVRGIGAPVIFLRTQGCHLRCYAATLGSLCDTPEGLKKDGNGTEMSTEEIITELEKIRVATGGIDLVCLSGGDPLWRHPEQLHDLFHALRRAKFLVSVETSGTISMIPFTRHVNVTWVLDFKLKSAGIKQGFCYEDVSNLTHEDIIKFVVYDEADYLQFKEVLDKLLNMVVGPFGFKDAPKFAVGLYWNTPHFTPFQLVQRLMADGLFGKVILNFQAHKALFTSLDNIDPKLT